MAAPLIPAGIKALWPLLAMLLWEAPDIAGQEGWGEMLRNLMPGGEALLGESKEKIGKAALKTQKKQQGEGQERGQDVQNTILQILMHREDIERQTAIDPRVQEAQDEYDKASELQMMWNPDDFMSEDDKERIRKAMESTTTMMGPRSGSAGPGRSPGRSPVGNPGGSSAEGSMMGVGRY